MAWFLVKTMGVTFDGRGSFPTHSFACSEGTSVEERAATWGLKKADPRLGLPDLFYREELTAEIMSQRNLDSVATHGYTIKRIKRPINGAWVCGDGLLCTIPPNSRHR